jgi:hypothetical protein
MTKIPQDTRIVIMHDGLRYVRVEWRIGEVDFYGPYPTRKKAEAARIQLKDGLEFDLNKSVPAEIVP